MNKGKFSWQNRLFSFSYAWQGIKTLIKEEHNTRIHLAAAFLVLVGGWLFRVNRYEWILLLLCIGFVFVTEIINTALEDLADIVCPERDMRIKKIKDIASAAVLVSAMISAIIAAIIFIPRILAFL